MSDTYYNMESNGKSKDLRGRARQCYTTRKIYLEIKGYIFIGDLFGLPKSRLSPLEHIRLELTNLTQ
jgi:hypothetical protein